MTAGADPTLLRLAEAVAATADRARGALLRRIWSVRALRPALVPVLASRAQRLALAQAFAVGAAALLALRAPLVSLWLGAALFGVPHVVAGVRAVAVQRRTARVAQICAAAGAAVGVAELAGLPAAIALRTFVVLFAAAIAWEIVAARRHPALAAVALAPLAAGALAAFRSPFVAVVAIAHLHGMASLVYFGVIARRRGLPIWPLAIGAAAIVLAAAAGVLDGAMASTLYAPRGAARSIVDEAISAGLPRTSAAVFHRALFLYAFGQSLHFAAWLRLLPDADRRAAVPQTFRRALADLRADFGRLTGPLLLLSAVAVVLLFTGGGPARDAYFALSYFHVGLEGAALARLALTRRPRVAVAVAAVTAPVPAPVPETILPAPAEVAA